MSDVVNGWAVNQGVWRNTIHFIKDRKSLCGRFELWWRDRDRTDDLLGADPRCEEYKCKICLKKVMVIKDEGLQTVS